MVRPMLKRKIFGIALCVAALVVLIAGWAWARSGRSVSTDNAYVRGDVTSLAPRVSGYVTIVRVQDNQVVRAGDILFHIDDRDYRARLAQADANVEAARARLANAGEEIELQQAVLRQAQAQRRAAEADQQLARRTSARRRELVDSGAVSQAQVDESDAGRVRTEAGASASSATVEAQRQRIDMLTSQRQAAVAALAQAEAAREIARIDLEHTIVRAPISGIVGNRQVRVGRLVAPGTSLLDIVPVDLFVVANFKETQLEGIRPGQVARIRIDAYPGVTLDGVVESFAPGSGTAFSLIPVDNATGNFVRVVQRVPVRIRLQGNPLPGRLVTGLSARVDVDTSDAS